MLPCFFRRGAVTSRLLMVLSLAGLTNAHAAYTITMTESGGNVVATGGGSLNIADLTLAGAGNALAFVQPNSAAVYVGPSSLTASTSLSAVTGPSSVGTGATLVQADSGGGDIVGIDGNQVVVPTGYVSGNALSSNSSWTGTTFAGLGLTPGTYTWTWGSGPNADSFVLQIGPTPASTPQSIPTLSEWAMIIMAALMAVGGVRYSKR